jgi:hypothetical protein
MRNKIDNTFKKAMEQVETLEKAFENNGSLEKAIIEVEGELGAMTQVRELLKSMYSALEDAHYDALGHLDENMTRPSRTMTLSEESFDGPRVGRKLQALAVKEPNDMIANAMATVADHLETWGATFGPKNMQDLVKKTGYSSEIIKMVIQRANKAVEESATITEAPFDGPRIGRKLQALAPKEPNDTIANAMANLADHLEDWGASFGPKSMQDLVKKTGLTAEVIKMLVQRAAKSTNPDYGMDKSVNEAGGYYTQPVYDMIEKHGYEKVMHELLTALHADTIQDAMSRMDMEESVNEGAVKNQMIDDSENMTKAEFAKKYGKEAADDMYESVSEAKDDKLHKQRDPNFVAMTKRKKGAHQDKKKMAKGGYEKHKSKMTESESAELDAIFEEIKLELKIKGN